MRWYVYFRKIVGILAGALIIIAPFMGFLSYSYEGYEMFNYNLITFCDRATLVSYIWKAIPLAFIVTGIIMVIMAFFENGYLRIIPISMNVTTIIIMIYAGVTTGKSIIRLFKIKADQEKMSIAQVLDMIGPCSYMIIAGLIIYIVTAFSFKESKSK